MWGTFPGHRGNTLRPWQTDAIFEGIFLKEIGVFWLRFHWSWLWMIHFDKWHVLVVAWHQTGNKTYANKHPKSLTLLIYIYTYYTYIYICVYIYIYMCTFVTWPINTYICICTMGLNELTHCGLDSSNNIWHLCTPEIGHHWLGLWPGAKPSIETMLP